MAIPTITTRAAVIIHGRQHHKHRFAIKGTGFDTTSSVNFKSSTSARVYDLDFERIDDAGTGKIGHTLVVLVKRQGQTFSGGSIRQNPGDVDNITYTVTNSDGESSTANPATVDVTFD
jgi:hypothetical protein